MFKPKYKHDSFIDDKCYIVLKKNTHKNNPPLPQDLQAMVSGSQPNFYYINYLLPQALRSPVTITVRQQQE